MTFNPKIDCILECVTNEDRVSKMIINDFTSILPDDTLEDIEKGCSSYLDDYNYTYCDNYNDMYEVGYHTDPISSDLTIAKHIPVYDDGNYIGRNLVYLLRVITNNNGKNLCYIYNRDENYIKTYKISTYYEKNYPNTLTKKK